MTESLDNSVAPQRLDPAQQTQRWLSNIVVGLNLCPFAAPVLKQGGLHIEVCEAELIDHLLAAVLQQLDKIQQCDESSIATSLLVFSHGLTDFDQYWDFVEIANEVLVEVGLEGIIQIATFHPNYCFEGMDEDDVSNYTNRSPYPMLHFIREEQLEKALASYPDVDKIPDTNIQRLQSLGKTELLKLLAQ
ncbi:MAG: DUF1415 domain-containing protein [Spongiibacteraceae bacterium]